MRIATKTRYALRFMIDLAEHESEGRIPMKKIAERQLISKKYLEQVVAPLSEAGLITVTRGATGGYAIARPAREITFRRKSSEQPKEICTCSIASKDRSTAL